MAVVKKKTMRLNEMLDTGIVQEGDMLRYKARPTYRRLSLLKTMPEALSALKNAMFSIQAPFGAANHCESVSSIS